MLETDAATGRVVDSEKVPQGSCRDLVFVVATGGWRWSVCRSESVWTAIRQRDGRLFATRMSREFSTSIGFRDSLKDGEQFGESPVRASGVEGLHGRSRLGARGLVESRQIKQGSVGVTTRDELHHLELNVSPPGVGLVWVFAQRRFELVEAFEVHSQ